jgi:phenylacetic acid degradation operon negative regulatory protein
MMNDKILSRLRDAPTSDFIYSSLSFYGRHRGGALPGVWFVAALTPLGVEEGAIRQTMFRMERSGVLEARRAGRTKLYTATATTRAIIDAGLARIFEPPAAAWDGEWTLVHFRFDNDLRQARDRIRDLLQVEGFAPLGPGLYTHPHDRTARVRQAVEELGLSSRLHVFRGRLDGSADDRSLVEELWNLAGLAKRYRAFLKSFTSLASMDVDRWTPAEAFALRFACVFRFFRIAWDDPELPLTLLPAGWPGGHARSLTRSLYEALQQRAIVFGDEILDRVWPEHSDVPRVA